MADEDNHPRGGNSPPTPPAKAPAADKKPLGWKITLPLCLGILALAGGVIAFIYLTGPTAGRGGATKETAMLVDVLEAERGDYRPEIVVIGTVRPAEDIILSPRVEGEVIERSRAFTPGGIVAQGEPLLKIDPADFENRLEQSRAELRQAESDLEVEMGRQDVARQDYQLLGEELTQEDLQLVLREPQLKAARARVESARAALRQRELDLERTQVRAPFDAQVIERTANTGSQVAPGDALGRLVGLDEYWVVATVPQSKLRWVQFPNSEDEPGARVRIRNRAAWPEDVYRTGRVERLIGTLDEQTRLARILVTVPDPLARGTDDRGQPPLLIGSIVEARIAGEELGNVVRLDRDYLREGDTVWVNAGGELQIRAVTVLFRDARYAYIAEGLDAGAQVITSSLSTVAEGAALRVEGSGGGENAASPGGVAAGNGGTQGAGS